MSNKKNFKKVAYICAILLLVLVVLYSGLRILESAFFKNETVTETYNSKTVVIDGKEYYPRQDITVVMLLGIDEEGKVQSSGLNTNTGEADVVLLMVMDDTAKIYDILCLNRDTMVNMPVIGINGENAGTRYGQLALSHVYGSGLSDSCENTRKTLTDLIKGININYYVALNMDAITIANDAVGGVTVNVTDDFSSIDPTISMGEVTLMGEQATNFVRTRKGLGDSLNISRMERQKEYMRGFGRSLAGSVDEDGSFVIGLYEELADYMVTDCSTTVMGNLLQRWAEYSAGDIVSPEGDNRLGSKYYEFYLDEDKFDKLVIDMFYAEKA